MPIIMKTERDKMTEELITLIKRAKEKKMSEKDKEAQKRSFAYGNVKIENELVTREMIDEISISIALEDEEE